VPVVNETVERAKSLLGTKPETPYMQNNSLVNEFDEFAANDLELSLPMNDFDMVKLEDPERRPEQEVADRLRSIENFNNGEQN
jgi:hypothetical protein